MQFVVLVFVCLQSTAYFDFGASGNLGRHDAVPWDLALVLPSELQVPKAPKVS